MGGAGDPLAPVIRLAPAKLNLTLAVLGLRTDGYHDLHSVLVPLALADRVSVSLAQRADDSLHVTGRPTGAGTDDLVLRAIAATRRAVGGGWSGGPRPAPGVAARLDKRIPVAAGLGGGSSDAAATMDAVVELWTAELDDATRATIVRALGSDVPFFLAGGPALIEGRGERVTRLPGLGAGPAVLLVTPAVAVSTPDVFAAFAAIRGTGDGAVRQSSEHLASELAGAGLGATDLVARAGIMAAANDLLPAAALVLPSLVPFRRALTRLLHRPIGLSGSGPTLWALYPSLEEATMGASDVEAAVSAGTLAAPGDDRPSIIATTITTTNPATTASRRTDP